MKTKIVVKPELNKTVLQVIYFGNHSFLKKSPKNYIFLYFLK